MLRGTSKELPEIMEIVRICKEYGYTEEEYDNLSEDFTQAIIARRRVEAQLRHEENQKLGDMQNNAPQGRRR